MSALTLTDIQSLQAGDVFFMNGSTDEQPVQCVVDADGDTVVGRNDLPGVILFSVADIRANIATGKNLNAYADWLFWSEQDVRIADEAADIASAERIAANPPGDILKRLFRYWASENGSAREHAAMRQAMLDAYGVDVKA